MYNATKPRDEVPYKWQLLSPDRDQRQIKWALCWPAPCRSNLKSPTEIVHKLGRKEEGETGQ